MKKCKELFAEYNIILILVLILGYGIWFVPYFASANNVYKLLADFSMYGIAAIGMSFLLISGEIDLSLGMSVALSTSLSVPSTRTFAWCGIGKSLWRKSRK